MLFNVPQFIDIEDKIVGPFTGKQLGWMAVAGVILLILWNILDTSAFIVAAIVVCGIFGALAFYKPYNQPLTKFIASSFHFAFKPKMYVWKRSYADLKINKSKKPVKKEEPYQRKTLTSEKIQEIIKRVE